MRLLLIALLTALATAAPPLDMTVHDKARNRDVPVRVYLPSTREKAPVILFSHGLGGARTNNAYLGEHWSKNGPVVVFMQHAGSDESVWKGVPLRQVRRRLSAAASAENFRLRAEDVKAVLDQLERWNAEGPLAGRLDLERIGMSGHSFGALTTQAVSGQSFGRLGTRYTDPRIKAALAFSPSQPRVGKTSDAFGSVRIPWMLMTGTEDVALVGKITVEDRLAVFPALPPGSKYELVLSGAEHSAFGDRPLPGDKKERNPRHHEEILALSTAFWKAYLLEEVQARAWLDGDGARQALEPGDRWQLK